MQCADEAAHTGPISFCMRIDRRLCVMCPITARPEAARGRASPPPSSSLGPSSASELGPASPSTSRRLQLKESRAGTALCVGWLRLKSRAEDLLHFGPPGSSCCQGTRKKRCKASNNH